MTGAAKGDIKIEKEITVMVTMSETYKVKLEKPFSCIGNVFAVDSSFLMGDPNGSRWLVATHYHVEDSFSYSFSYSLPALPALSA